MRDKLLALIVGLLLSTAVFAVPPTPEEFLGFSVGTDRKLASYTQVLSYLRQVAAASDRVMMSGTAGAAAAGACRSPCPPAAWVTMLAMAAPMPIPAPNPAPICMPLSFSRRLMAGTRFMNSEESVLAMW